MGANLWHQLFKSTDYVKLAGNRDFFHKRVKRLLTNEQALRITEALGKDVINRKADFLKSRETDTAKLRLSLQELFTKIVIKRIISELARSKEDAIARLEHLASLDDQALKKHSVQQEKSIEKNKKVAEAESRINDLLGIVNEHLKETRDEFLVVGSLRHTLGLLEEFLNQSAEENVVSLPKIIEGARTNDDNDKSIYKSEYDQLPQDVREYFAESVTLIDMANEAAAPEGVAIADYKLIHDKINAENRNGEQLNDLREKVANIEEAEEIASKIVEAQTFWRYEGVPAPGDDEKISMNASTLQKIIDDLTRISDTLEDPNLERNTMKLQEEILSAKDYIQQLKSALPAYSNISTIKTAIFEAEATIAAYDDVIARRIKEAEVDAATSS